MEPLYRVIFRSKKDSPLLDEFEHAVSGIARNIGISRGVLGGTRRMASYEFHSFDPEIKDKLTKAFSDTDFRLGRWVSKGNRLDARTARVFPTAPNFSIWEVNVTNLLEMPALKTA